MLTQAEQRKAAREFAQKWKGKGYEKGESAKFWLSLLQDVYGIKHPDEFIRFEDKVMLDNTSFIDGYIPSTHVLIEQKSIEKDLRKPIKQSDGSLLSPFQQAKRYSAELPYSERPRWIVTSNFEEFHIYDMEKPGGEPEVVLLKELENDYYRMLFLVDEEDEHIQKEIEVSIKAGELVGVLYDALLKEYKNPEDEKTLKDLNVLCVRLVFCFYAEDAGLFASHGLFHDYLDKYKDVNFRDALIKVFRVLNQKIEDRDPYLEDDLASFPYVNGGLFEDKGVIIPRINDEIIDIILNKASANFDWSHISPTIFGGVFESTLNPETRRSGGMHYTSIKNIHKVTDPLFMNELNEEFEEIKEIKVERTRNKRLKKLQDKMASLKFLDPASGSGNFLTETYLSLRRLENKIIKLLYGEQIFMGISHNPIKVSIDQFYGIEINDFAVTVSRTALWIAEAQMFIETEDIIHANIDFLPLKSSANIVEANALKIDWEDIISKKETSYIMGNPPFIGARFMNSSQKEDMKKVFGKIKGLGNLDYVSCWYKKASEYIDNTEIECAFVSTNSITQGEQVAILWGNLYTENEISINFAYPTFIWDSEANQKAHVHCVIVGFSQVNLEKKHIYMNKGLVKRVKQINGYLVEAPMVFIERRRKPLLDVKPMIFGSMANDGGYLILSSEEKEELLKKYPGSSRFIRKFLGAREFINGLDRWCLWINPENLLEASKIKPIMERVSKVKETRLKSKRKSTRELANYSYRFGEVRQPDTQYLLIPRVSSENRRYIPIGYIDESVVASDAVMLVPESSISLFSILSSNVHMAWVRTTAGRLKSDYRYSASIVYNNFPFINLNTENKKMLKKTGNQILKARNIYKDWSLADLYNELTMPPELRKAHQENDKAVMKAYGFDWKKMSESDCVAELMKMYQELVEE